MSDRRLVPPARVDADIRLTGDKSISHRALIIGALTAGHSYIGNCCPAADVRSTMECLRACGVWLRAFGDDRVTVEGNGAAALRSPDETLDCGNSGTTMRLLCGALAAAPVRAVLDGDASLRRRPMERVAEPLCAMGAEVTTESGHAPLRVTGRTLLRATEHRMTVASAQVKSAVLLAALGADGVTTIHEPLPTRDHTERLLRLCGVAVDSDRNTVRVHPAQPQPFGLQVPGDISAAAFPLALAAPRRGWRVRCAGVGLNRSRTGVLDVLRAMGARLEISDVADSGGEPVGDVEVRGASLHGTVISGELTVRCIDELPVLAVLATQADGTTEIRDAGELRAKESDRLSGIRDGLRALGARCDDTGDGLVVHGPVRLRGARLASRGDHRLAMAWAVAGLLACGESVVEDADSVDVSFPGFFDALQRWTTPG